MTTDFMSTKKKEKLLKFLEDAIDEIYRHPNTENFNDVDLYQKACELVDEDCEENLEDFVDRTVSWELGMASESLKAAPEDGEFLRELNERYRDHKKAIERLGNILMLMDMDYAEKGKKTMQTEVHELTHSLWKDYMVGSTQILTRIVNTLLDLIHRERGGKTGVADDRSTFEIRESEPCEQQDAGECPSTSQPRNNEDQYEHDGGDNDLTFWPDGMQPQKSFQVYNTHWHPALAGGPSTADLPLEPVHKAMAEVNLYGLRAPSVREHMDSDPQAISPATIPAASAIDHGLMRNTIMMIMDMDPSIYREAFEAPFLKASAEFYAVESSRLLSELDDHGEYIGEVERRLEEEVKRVYLCLDEGTEVHITNVVLTEMLEKHMDTLFFREDSWFRKMLTSDNYDALSRVYNLLNRTPDGVWPIRSAMALHVVETVKRDLFPLIEDANQAHQLSLRIGALKEKYVNIVKNVFKDNPQAHEELNNTFDLLFS